VHHARCHRREILLTIEVSEAGEHPRLRQRGFSDTRIAEKDRKFFGGRFQRSDHFDGLAPSAKEKVRVGFGHGGKTAIGRGVPPKFAGKRATAGGSVHHLDALLRRRVRTDDPMQLPQERQSWRRLAVEQHEDNWKIVLFHAAVERFRNIR
jgi:hypothetical protein